MKAGNQELMILEYEELAGKIIACAIEVHKRLGPGFLESVYESVLILELKIRGFLVKQQYDFVIKYKDTQIGKHYIGLLINDKIVLELKAVKKIITQ